MTDLSRLDALSVRQPWAWLIFHGKPIENRSWHTRRRGRIAIHASKGMTRSEYEDAVDFVARIRPALTVPAPHELDRGGVIGTVDLIDCISESENPWFFGPYGFVLRDPVEIDFVPCRGALGFFPVPVHELKR